MNAERGMDDAGRDHPRPCAGDVYKRQEEMCKVFGIPKLRQKAHFCAISSTSGTATEVTAFSIITDYAKGIKYPIADFEITPDVAIVDPELSETMPK